jgi:hypothetical protein
MTSMNYRSRRCRFSGVSSRFAVWTDIGACQCIVGIINTYEGVLLHVCMSQGSAPFTSKVLKF